MKRQLIIVFGVLISVVFLFLAFRGLDPAAAWEYIRAAQPGWLVVGALTYFIAVIIISLRWQFLLRSVVFIPLRKLIPLVSIGYMGNNIYPFRSGEALRVYLLKRNHDIAIARGATTVLIERVFDGIVMLTFIVVPLLFIETTSDDIQQVASFAAPVFLIALVLFFGLAAKPDWLRGLLRLVERVLPEKLAELVDPIGEDIIIGLEGLRTPGNLAGAVVCSYATWAVEAGVYWIVSWAFDLGLGYPTMLLVVGTVNLAGLIPASPGQIGVFEFFVRSVVVGAGVGAAVGLAYAVVVHVVIWLPVTLLGFFFLVREGLSLKAVTRARELEDQAQTIS
jgi:glycosyltransferase 2 family protein